MTNLQSKVDDRAVKHSTQSLAEAVVPFRCHSDFATIPPLRGKHRNTLTTKDALHENACLPIAHPIVMDWCHPRPERPHNTTSAGETKVLCVPTVAPTSTVIDMMLQMHNFIHVFDSNQNALNRDIQLRGHLPQHLAWAWFIYRYVHQNLRAVRPWLLQKHPTARLLSPADKELLHFYGVRIDPQENTLHEIKYGISLVAHVIKSMSYLDMNDVLLKDFGQIGCCKSLRILIAPNNYIRSLAPLKACEQLELLDVSNNKIAFLPEDVFQQALSRRLRFFYLANNNFWHCEQLDPLKYCRRLLLLDLRGTLLACGRQQRTLLAAHVRDSFPSVVVLNSKFISTRSDGPRVDVSSSFVLAAASETAAKQNNLLPNVSVEPFAKKLKQEYARWRDSVRAHEGGAVPSSSPQQMAVDEDLTHGTKLCENEPCFQMWNLPATACIPYSLTEPQPSSALLSARIWRETKSCALLSTLPGGASNKSQQKCPMTVNFLEECEAESGALAQCIRFPQIFPTADDFSDDVLCINKFVELSPPTNILQSAPQTQNLSQKRKQARNIQKSAAKQKTGFVYQRSAAYHRDQQTLTDYGLTVSLENHHSTPFYLRERCRLFEPKQHSTKANEILGNKVNGVAPPAVMVGDSSWPQRRQRKQERFASSTVPNTEIESARSSEPATTTTAHNEHFAYVRRMADMYTETEQGAIRKHCRANVAYDHGERRELRATVRLQHAQHRRARQARTACGELATNMLLKLFGDSGKFSPVNMAEINRADHDQYNRFMYLKAKKENQQVQLMQDEFQDNLYVQKLRNKHKEQRQLKNEHRQAAIAAEYEALASHGRVLLHQEKNKAVTALLPSSYIMKI